MRHNNREDTNPDSPYSRLRRRYAVVVRDYAALLAMQKRSWEINFRGEAFHEETFRGSLQSSVDRDEVYVYELIGELVGWLWLDPKAYKGSAHIRHIQVRESHWGRAMGRGILEDAVSMCIGQGMRDLTLNVTKTNLRAMALYKHMGFVVDEDRGDRQRMRLELRRGRGWRDRR